LINSQENIRSTTLTKARMEVIVPHKMAVPMEMKSPTRKEARVAIAAAKSPLKSPLQTKQVAEPITQTTNVISPSRDLSCTASTCITQASPESNTKPSSTCVVFNQSLSTWNLVKVQPSCSRTAFSRES
jgi:hypothetical protein